jgi:hypothetical protein
MLSSFAHSQYMPCADCGASVASADSAAHVCDPERLLEYQLFQLHDEIAGFDDGLRSYLASPHGRFAQWLAAFDRRRAEGG